MNPLRWLFPKHQADRVENWHPMVMTILPVPVRCLDCGQLSRPKHDHCVVCGSKAIYLAGRK